MPFLDAILWAALITLALALAAGTLGLFLAVLYTFLVQLGFKKTYTFFASINVVLRALPELVTLFVIYFSLTAFINDRLPFNIYMPPFLAGTLALGLTFSAYATQTILGAFKAISTGQKESGVALGLSTWQTFYRIQLPQAGYYALPGLGNLWITLLKDTAFVSLIGLPEIMNRAQLAISTTKQPFNYYLLAALLYLIMTSISQWGIHQLEHHYKQ